MQYTKMPTFEACVMKSTFSQSDLPTLPYQFAMRICKYAPRQKNHLATQMTQFLESSIAIRLQIWTPYYNFSSELLASSQFVYCVYSNTPPPSPFRLLPDHRYVCPLGPDLSLWGSAPDALRLRTLQMLRGDPALVIGLSSGCDSRVVSTNNTSLVGWVDFLATAGRCFGALATFTTTALLREEGGDPGVVDEVDGSTEGCEKDGIEEDTVNM